MATINNRVVRVLDGEVIRVGVTSGWQPGSPWLTVTFADGSRRQVHEEEWLEIVRDE